jgi:putative membrane protein
MMGYYGGGHMSGWGWAMMAFSSLIFWSILVIAVVLIVRALRDRDARGPRDGSSSAEDILRQRFARGEIDDAEYRQRLQVLGNNEHADNR